MITVQAHVIRAQRIEQGTYLTILGQVLPEDSPAIGNRITDYFLVHGPSEVDFLEAWDRGQQNCPYRLTFRDEEALARKELLEAIPVTAPNP
ncbi:MAG: hypothetical protein WAN50_00095 [Minisyncoccia bacterium]